MPQDLGSTRTHTHTTAIGSVLAVLGLSFLLLMFLPVPAEATSPQDATKVTICHASDSYTNPYGSQDVDIASVKFEGHDDHDGPVFYAEIPKHTKWGDIIPPFDYGDGLSYPGKNWTAEGQLILSYGCALTPPSSTTTVTEPVSDLPSSTTTTGEISPTNNSIDPTTTESSVAPTTAPTDPDVSPIAPAGVDAATVSQGTLPVTGAPVLLLTVLGLALVMGGVALVVVGRRQNPTHA